MADPRVKIADMVFPFQNKTLIDLLFARGQKIAAQKWDKLEQVENKISTLLDKKAQQAINPLMRPTHAFITFNDPMGKDLALKMVKDPAHPFFKQKFSPAPMPNDIIWQNRWNTPWNIALRELASYTMIAIVIGVIFFIIYNMTLYTTNFLY